VREVEVRTALVRRLGARGRSPRHVWSSARFSSREVKEHGHFHRRFEELRLDDLALVRQASRPELLRTSVAGRT
jgi:hypothetical protein